MKTKNKNYLIHLKSDKENNFLVIMNEADISVWMIMNGLLKIIHSNNCLYKMFFYKIINK